ncbi:hypothetical protein [Salicibibacter kimchii]|uniref:hypothetical protein n=1 Tax=Salicibibacter kimchii TaxID=2099786 RepID=UPI00135C3C35|nr:hypothetical protein [Salicibibacter kimchii]
MFLAYLRLLGATTRFVSGRPAGIYRLGTGDEHIAALAHDEGCEGVGEDVQSCGNF